MPDALQKPVLPSPQGSVPTEGKWLAECGVQQLAEIINSLNDERTELVREKQRWTVEKDCFASIITDKEKDHRVIRRLERKLADSRTEIARLNFVIVERGQLDEVLDEGKLVNDYRHLLRTIDDIARSHYLSPIVRPLRLVAGLSKEERQECEKSYGRQWAGWDEFSPEERNYRVRSLIFEALHDEYFGHPLSGFQRRVERGLTTFENGDREN